MFLLNSTSVDAGAIIGVIFISNFAFSNLYNEDMLLQNLLMI